MASICTTPVLGAVLVINGGDDQIVPIADSAILMVKLVKSATLKVYPDAPHGLCSPPQ